jgi:anti-sigma-K factor RskA
MSDEDAFDALAAEYALGCLEGDDLRQAEQLLSDNPAFARAVAAWQTRLAPLAALVPAASPPDGLWDRIDASTTPMKRDNVVPLRRMRFWQASTAGALAIAASLAAFMILRPAPPTQIAVLAQMAGGTPVLLATAEPDGRLTIRPNGAIGIPSGRDLELWALAKGDSKPRSLGVLPASGRRMVASLAPDTQLLVSLEPQGGSPTGQPTGPVLFGGTLTLVN